METKIGKHLIGKILIVVALLIGAYAMFIMNVSVDSGLPERVNNFGLMSDKQNYLFIAGILFLSGIVLVSSQEATQEITNETEQENSSPNLCPKCKVELVQDKANSSIYECPKCGDRFQE